MCQFIIEISIIFLYTKNKEIKIKIQYYQKFGILGINPTKDMQHLYTQISAERH